MIRFFYRQIIQHLSLLIIVIGAVSFFLSNLLMKEVLSITEYGHYSLVVSYLSLIYVLGIFGAEQVFLRFSVNEGKNLILTQKPQLFIVSSVIIFSSTIATFLFRKYYPEIAFNPVLLFFTSISMIGLLLTFNVFRLNSNFILAQFISTYWKIALFILALFFYLAKGADLPLFIEIVSYNIILIFVCSVLLISVRIKIHFNNDIGTRQLLHTAFHFFLAILSFSLITFSDRFIIERKYSFEEFGNFFYLTNFFLAPYTILQNYVGFKQLIFFKTEFNKSYFSKMNNRIFLFGSVLAFVLFFAAYFLNTLNLLRFNFTHYRLIIILLLITGIIRLYSSSIISAFEARTTLETLKKSNIYIFAVTITILLIACFVAHSIESILLCIISIWAFRCLIHRTLLLRQMKNAL